MVRDRYDPPPRATRKLTPAELARLRSKAHAMGESDANVVGLIVFAVLAAIVWVIW